MGSKVVPPSDGPYLPGFHWFEVETLGRVYTLMTRTVVCMFVCMYVGPDLATTFIPLIYVYGSIVFRHPIYVCMYVCTYRRRRRHGSMRSEMLSPSQMIQAVWGSCPLLLLHPSPQLLIGNDKSHIDKWTLHSFALILSLYTVHPPFSHTYIHTYLHTYLHSATIAESFLTNPTQWNLGDRLLLNGRRAFLGRESRANIEGQDPCL